MADVFSTLHCIMLRKIALLLAIGLSHAAKLPDTWERCEKGDTFLECRRRAVEHAVKSMADTGNPSFGVLPLDPMHFERLLIEQTTGPVAIKLEFKNIDVTGIKNLVITELSGDWNEFVVTAKSSAPLSVTGGYTIEGKVLALPIVGTGACNLTFHNFTWDPITVKFKEEMKKGKRYLGITEVTLVPTTTLLQMDFENLFNGDKMLGTQMNIFLNENWVEIFNEVKPAVSKGFAAAYKDIGNRVLSKIPADLFT